MEKEVRWLQEQLIVSSEEEATWVQVELSAVNSSGPGTSETQVGSVRDVSLRNTSS